MIEYKPMNKATFIKRLVFDLLFINTFSITMIYYDLPSLASIVPSNVLAALPVIIATILIVIRLIKKPRIKLNVVIYLSMIVAYILLSLMGNTLIADFVNGSSFIVYSVFCLYILIEDDIESLLKHLNIDACIIGGIYITACFLYSKGRLYSDNSAVSYMSLGYGMTLPAMLCFEFYRKENRKIYIAMASLLSVLILLFGNRGALIMITLYVIICAFQTLEGNSKRKSIVIIVIGITFIIFAFFGGMDYAANLIAGFLGKTGFDSRNILKLISGSIWIDRDRVLIRKKAYEMISSNPLAIRGPGALTREYISQSLIGANAHNMVLELWVEYGVLFGSIASFFLYKKIFDVIRMNLYKAKKNCGIAAYTTILQGLIMLLFSGTLYTCNALWVGLAMISACSHLERKLE